MDNNILKAYMDACELIRETNEDIQKLQRKKKTIIQDSVCGSNPQFPYEQKHFKIQGTAMSMQEDSRLQREMRILEERKDNAEKLKIEVEAWMNTIPLRMQRIIRYKIFEGLTWEQTAAKIGRKASGDSVRMEYHNFMKK